MCKFFALRVIPPALKRPGGDALLGCAWWPGGLVAWLSACLLACLSGILVAWLPGCAAWLPGCLAAWLPGCLGQAGRAKIAEKMKSKNLEIVKKMGTENLQNGGPNPPKSSPEGAKRGPGRPKNRKRR